MSSIVRRAKGGGTNSGTTPAIIRRARMISSEARQNIERVPLGFGRDMVLKKKKLRDLGYQYTMTLYGHVYQGGFLRAKRIEILSKNPVRQVHNAFMYEVFVQQDLTKPSVMKFHAKYPVLQQARFMGIPKDDYLVLTWNELKNRVIWDTKKSWDVEDGQWIEYEQQT